MLVVCFGDGLGNQMFQYAFYRELVYKYPRNRVYADICNFYGSVNDHNGYELERIFNIQIPECSRHKAMELADYYGLGNKKHPVLNRIFGLRIVIFGRKRSFISVDDPTEFYKEIFDLNPLNSYMLRGNWINENYFIDIKEQLYHDFIFPPIVDEKNLEIAKKIKDTLSVSIHIRRGDYITSGVTSLNTVYYTEAIDMIKNRIHQELHFFVFSDDIEYCRQVLQSLSNVTFIDVNKGDDSFRDMQLMSLCKHNIIANSTFSYWGAYLNQNIEKIVIAPRIGMKLYHNPIALSDWTLI